MLKADEIPYDMPLATQVRDLLNKESDSGDIEPCSVITYRVPFNACVQIFNYVQKSSRIVFGPSLVMLNPDETFTVNILSGGKPKMPGMITSLYLTMGPEFTSDIIEVETSDHCKMQIKVSYNWYFKVDKSDKSSGEKMFAIRDFIGDMCTVCAAKIRSACAGVTFENFHSTSARLIRIAIFGTNEEDKINDE